MTVMPELRAMTRIKISAEGGDAAYGRIEDIRPPAEWDIQLFAEDEHITRIARISCSPARDSEVIFTAFEIYGHWFDRNGRLLNLEVIGQFQWQPLLQ